MHSIGMNSMFLSNVEGYEITLARKITIRAVHYENLSQNIPYYVLVPFLVQKASERVFFRVLTYAWEPRKKLLHKLFALKNGTSP